MAAYVVMEAPADRNGERTLFIRSGFSVFAFALTLVWLVWRRLWVEAAIVLALTLAFSLAARQGWIAEPAVAVASLLVSLYFGMEATTMRIAGLARHGWQEAGLVQADNTAEAEIRWFTDHASTPAVDTAPQVPVSPLKPAMAGRAPEPFMGLFDYSGDR